MNEIASATPAFHVTPRTLTRDILMIIPETDCAEINRALAEMDNLYQASARFGEEIVKKAQFICEDACQRPEFWEGGFNMDAGLEAVVAYFKTHYPWLSQRAVWAVRHKCFMENK